MSRCVQSVGPDQGIVKPGSIGGGLATGSLDARGESRRGWLAPAALGQGPVALGSAAAAQHHLARDARAPRAVASPTHQACVGLMLRHDWCDALLAHRGQVPVDFIEVYPENYLRRGPRLARELAALAEAYPITLHAVHHNVAGSDPLSATFCADVRAFADGLSAHWVSDHVAASAHRGELLHELVPVPLTPENAAHVARRALALSEHLGRPVLLENTAYYLRPESSSCDEAEFLRALFASQAPTASSGASSPHAPPHADASVAAERRSPPALAGEVGWLFDVNNWVVNALNFGFDPIAALDDVPLSAARELHIGGFSVDAASGLVLDSHATAPAPLVLALLEEAVARIGPIPVCFEWERNFGAWSQVVAVLERVENATQRGLSRWWARRETGSGALSGDRSTHAEERGSTGGPQGGVRRSQAHADMREAAVATDVSEAGARHVDSA